MGMAIQRGTYVMLSQQEAMWGGIKTVANNFSNANTVGFKAMHQVDQASLQKSFATHENMTYLQTVGMVKDMRDGGLKSTQAPLDVALRGRGFFKVQTPQGTNYTRAGHFYKEPASGKLITPQGYPVLSDGGSEIVIPEEANQISIAEDGTISTNLGIMGKLGLADFEDLQALIHRGDNLLSTDQSEIQATHCTVMQGYLEESNTDTMQEMVRMMTYYRMYEQAQRFMDQEDDRIKKMINVSPKNNN